MKKRILGFALCATLIAGALAGCGSKATEETKTSSKMAGSTMSASSTKSETKSEMATSSKPEPVTLNVAYMPNYGSLWAVENAIAQGYLEEEGIRIVEDNKS